MTKRMVLLVFLAAFLGSVFAQALGFGAVLWWNVERAKVLSLGNKPTVTFCTVASWLNYYGFNRLERHQCESIIHPKITPVPTSPVEG